MARKLSLSEGWYLFAEVCSRNLALGGNTNPGYLDVEKMLSTWSVVEMTRSKPQKNRGEKCEWLSDANAAKRETFFPNIFRSTKCNSLNVSGLPD